ncbi:MAG TPA: hypothetical protein VF648_18890 [Pyrinomonadaceae bacterium]|jgi:hypothetical protein
MAFTSDNSISNIDQLKGGEIKLWLSFCKFADMTKPMVLAQLKTVAAAVKMEYTFATKCYHGLKDKKWIADRGQRGSKTYYLLKLDAIQIRKLLAAGNLDFVKTLAELGCEEVGKIVSFIEVANLATSSCKNGNSETTEVAGFATSESNYRAKVTNLATSENRAEPVEVANPATSSCQFSNSHIKERTNLEPTKELKPAGKAAAAATTGTASEATAHSPPAHHRGKKGSPIILTSAEREMKPEEFVAYLQGFYPDRDVSFIAAKLVRFCRRTDLRKKVEASYELLAQWTRDEIVSQKFNDEFLAAIGDEKPGGQWQNGGKNGNYRQSGRRGIVNKQDAELGLYDHLKPAITISEFVKKKTSG